MSPQEFLNNVSEALSYSCRELLGTKETAIVIAQAPFISNTYGQNISFRNEDYRIMLNKGITPNFLLCSFINLVARRINRFADFLAVTQGCPHLKSTYRPSTPIEWAEDFYLDLENELFQIYKMGLGIDFGVIDALSTMPYEGDRCDRGGLVFVEDPNKSLSRILSIQLRTEENVFLNKGMTKHIRKLLAGAGKKYYLLFQQNSKGDYQCLGYCKKNVATRFGWSISFQNTLDWEIVYKGKPFFRMFGCRPRVISDPIESVMEKLREEFAPLPVSGAEKILRSAQDQEHGTALIFADFTDSYIASWIENLYCCKRAVGIKLLQDKHNNGTDAEAVRSLSRMDGAIIVDVHTMKLKYVATIVDGKACISGDLARGSRHNSIKAFLGALVSPANRGKHKIAAVIFSEDGGATTICEQNIWS